MFPQLRKGRLALALAMVAVFCMGFVAPALAEDVKTYAPGDAVLTKVIITPVGTNTKDDEYVFHFAGGGTVTQSGDTISSDGVEQDGTTIKVDDVVPTIPDLTLKGVQYDANNTLTNGQIAQAVVQKSITEILEGVEFPHAGVYTYVVTEQSALTKLDDGTYINPSQAQYKLRIRVTNTKTENESELTSRELTVEAVTVELMKDDNGNDKDENGNDKTGKVDPVYPKAENGKITEVSEGKGADDDGTPLAGDARGRFVDGFTFANEYIKGGTFRVKKLYDGDHSDRTKYSWVELAVYSEAATNPDAHGACLTYRIEGAGIDRTENTDSDGEHKKLNGIYSDISQANDYMATFDDKGWVYVKAELKEDSYIRITGEFGPYDPEYADDPTSIDGNRRKILSTHGLLQGQTYYVVEREPGNYVPTGYVYVGENENADPRVASDGMTTDSDWLLHSDTPDPTDHPTSDYDSNPNLYVRKTIKAGALVVKGDATGSATTVFVVNKIDEGKVTATGILINNLPYILMIGIPVAVFAVMFVNKRRAHAEA